MLWQPGCLCSRYEDKTRGIPPSGHPKFGFVIGIVLPNLLKVNTRSVNNMMVILWGKTSNPPAL